MESAAARLIRYRNYAEELRVVARERISPQDYDALLRVAANYDQLAASLEGIIKSRQQINRER